MTHRFLTCIVVAAGFAAAAVTLDAHHGAAAYDLDQTTTLSATITSFAWTSPHALIGFDAQGGKGPVESWTAETAGLVILVRAGWTKTVIKPGDRITVIGHRARNGSHEWLGHSIGSWDGDTLVIDTVGFNDNTWLDRLGHPHSDGLHVIERVRRVDRNTLDYRITIDDLKAYTRPWEGRMTFGVKSGWSVLEHHCTTTGDAYLEYKARAWKGK